MNSAKPRASRPFALRRRASKMAGRTGASVEGFIYNHEPMDTLAPMFKRILILTASAVIGFAACLGSIRLAGSWSLMPNRELERSSDYIRDVLKTVNENYVDPGAAGYG